MFCFSCTRITRVPFGDQAIFIRRTYFQKIGGYQPIPIMEDIDLMRRVKKDGCSIAIIPKKTRTSARRYEQEGLVYCTLRNWILQALYLFGAAPDKLAKWY